MPEDLPNPDGGSTAMLKRDPNELRGEVMLRVACHLRSDQVIAMIKEYHPGTALNENILMRRL